MVRYRYTKAEWRYASALLRILCMRVSSHKLLNLVSWMSSAECSVGFQLVRASSMAWEVLSSSVRRTVALEVSPACIASAREFL